MIKQEREIGFLKVAVLIENVQKTITSQCDETGKGNWLSEGGSVDSKCPENNLYIFSAGCTIAFLLLKFRMSVVHF